MAVSLYTSKEWGFGALAQQRLPYAGDNDHEATGLEISDNKMIRNEWGTERIWVAQDAYLWPARFSAPFQCPS